MTPWLFTGLFTFLPKVQGSNTVRELTLVTRCSDQQYFHFFTFTRSQNSRSTTQTACLRQIRLEQKFPLQLLSIPRQLDHSLNQPMLFHHKSTLQSVLRLEAAPSITSWIDAL